MQDNSKLNKNKWSNWIVAIKNYLSFFLNGALRWVELSFKIISNKAVTSFPW